MPFDQTTRNRLARFVSDARSLLTEEFTRQMQHEYGLDPASGDITPIEKLTALDDARRETARILRETLDYYASPSPVNRERAGVRAILERILREQAFTVLNRLCALRMAEARGITLESVAQGYRSKGFQLYARLAGSALGETGQAYRLYLFSLFDELAVELPPLFDRFSPQGRLFPRETALLKLLDLLNDPELEALWAEDETIGWIYQYFNSKEERQAMRAASQAPRDSRELAVRNQFFTPRYVVEFLTDNTLGRIWYEMTRGETGLRDTCRYLVRRPNEIFLQEGEEAPAQAESAEDLTQEELLKQPVYIPHRPLKDPREIKMLDPACGSMHFGLYSFDLYEQIYAEAWEIEEAQGPGVFLRPAGLRSLHETYPDQDAFWRDVPRLIIEHNIHGIDIDSRAVQIAGLSLWLRAQKSWQAQGVKLSERPQICKSNIVCAEPMPGDRKMLDEFLSTLRENKLEALMRKTMPAGGKLRATKAMADALAKLVRTVWQEMELAGEAGSLLKIEETMREAIAQSRKESEEKAPLFRVLEYGMEAGMQDQTGPAMDFWVQAETLVLAALRQYTEQASNGASFRRRLFAGDAVQGFAFIDLCRQQYDLVLMNPPFGSTPPLVYEYLKKKYSNAFIDVLASFISRGQQLVHNGYVGAIKSRASFYTKTLAEWRDLCVINRLQLVADLGDDVLDDALVRTNASVISSDVHESLCLFLDLLSEENKKEEILGLLIEKIRKTENDLRIYIHATSEFRLLPQNRILFRLPRSFWRIIQSSTNFEPEIGTIRSGLTTYDDFRFLRLTWESPFTGWLPLSKGGYFETFYGQVHLLLKWFKEGAEVGAHNYNLYNTDAQSKRASSFFYQRCLTYPRRTTKGFSARALQQNCIFGDKGPAIIPFKSTPIYLLGFFNSHLIRALIHLQSHAGSFETGILKQLPWVGLPEEDRKKIESLSKRVWQQKVYWYIHDEVDTFFVVPIHSSFTSLGLWGKTLSNDFDISNKRIDSYVSEISALIDNSYGVKNLYLPEEFDVEITDHHIQNDLDANDLSLLINIIPSYILGTVFARWDIRYATGEKSIPEQPDPFAPLPACPPGMLQNARGLPAAQQDVPADYPLRITWGGILADDEGHPEDIEGRAREALHVIWGDRAEAIEAEACQILSVHSLREYFQKPALFFADHLKRYSKSRRQAPIYWSLSTPAGSYTLWLYYYRLNDQILFTCVNDFVDPKIKQVTEETARLRQKKARSAAEDKELERLADFEAELKDFRLELLRVAAFWKPNLNDGVQITAAPLWRLFQHRPWQKKLKETWGKLEAGDYDWAHLAYSIWPERVREKCRSDKSLAIAHDLEHLYVEPKASGKKKAGRKKKEEPEMEDFLDE